MACMQLDSDDLVLVKTSDHLVKSQQAYEAAIHKAKELAEKGSLVIFGIRSNYPETGFGYIQAEGTKVVSFTEKSDYQTAQKYIQNGNCYWNSGMFCYKTGLFLSELKRYSLEIFQACESASILANRSELRISLESPDESIDYAVMEKSNIVQVVPCDMGWSDLGSFDALYDEVDKDASDNAFLERAKGVKPICIDSKNNLVVSRDRQIALVDTDDLLLVDTSDAILISKKGSSQKVRQVVAEVRASYPELAEIHRLAYRSWGTYEVLVNTEGYKVKRIMVKPGERLSLQKHFHRNEDWIVVSVTATVTVDDDRFLVRPNESTYIKWDRFIDWKTTVKLTWL